MLLMMVLHKLITATPSFCLRLVFFFLAHGHHVNDYVLLQLMRALPLHRRYLLVSSRLFILLYQSRLNFSCSQLH